MSAMGGKQPRATTALKNLASFLRGAALCGDGAVMIFKRAVAKLRAQDWTANTIELLIDIIGVYLGTCVVNWNLARVDCGNTFHLLNQFKPQLRNQFDQFKRPTAYLATTGNAAS